MPIKTEEQQAVLMAHRTRVRPTHSDGSRSGPHSSGHVAISRQTSDAVYMAGSVTKPNLNNFLAPHEPSIHGSSAAGRMLFKELATGRWIENSQNLLITGPCGVGKNWLACALGRKACRDGKSVIYQRIPRLFAELELAHGDERFPRLFRQLSKVDILILDDWGQDRLTAPHRRRWMAHAATRADPSRTLTKPRIADSRNPPRQ